MSFAERVNETSDASDAQPCNRDLGEGESGNGCGVCSDNDGGNESVGGVDGDGMRREARIPVFVVAAREMGDGDV